MEEKRREEKSLKQSVGESLRECVMWLSKRTQMTENTLDTDIKEHYLVVLCVRVCVCVYTSICVSLQMHESESVRKVY